MCAAPCGGGFYGSGTECAGCPPGSNSAPGSETVMGCACPGSTYLAGPGDAGASWRCAACPPNSFSPLGSLSAADCLCKSGFYSSGSGADLTCAACPAGSVSPGGSINAESCQCPAGTFGNPPLSNCTQCPARSTSAEGSTGVEDCVCLWGFGVPELAFSRRITSPEQICTKDGLEFGSTGLSCSKVCSASGRTCAPFPNLANLGREWLEAAVEAKDVACSSITGVNSWDESTPFSQNPSDGSCYFNVDADNGETATCSWSSSADRRFCVCGCPWNHYGSGASCTPCPAGTTAPAGTKMATECVCRPSTYGEISAEGSGTCTDCTEGTAVASFRIKDTFSASSSDLHGWEGSTEVSQCGGLGAMLGGYAQLGRASFLKKTVTGLCSHNEVWLSFSLVAIDGWNGEDAILYADGVEVWRRPFSFSGASSCGGSGAEGSISGGIVLSHSARVLDLELRTTLTSEADVVSWGLESFTVYVDCAGESDAACAPIVAPDCAPIMVSYDGTCGLTLDGVECWGFVYYSSPSGKGVAIALGGGHTTLVVWSDGSLEGFGSNQYGSLGGGTGIIDLGGLKAVAVAAGYFHTVVLMQDGSVRAFGHNGYGQLGLGDRANRGDDADEMGVNLPPVPQTLTGRPPAFGGPHDLNWARVLDGFVSQTQAVNLGITR
ncbi:hypothetical protein T484DRAFT_3466965 [Baffinella frigidus]|nr:hypothetical protein T484DRAFT_3466965 [Cryptophyta sp. CCMP2293]